MHKRIKNAEGFTLIELMMSIVVLSIGILGVVGMFVTSINGNVQGKYVTEATTLAQSQLDSLTNSVAYVNLVNGSDTAKFHDTDITYTRTWTITDMFPLNGLNMKKIDVQVSWVSRGKHHVIQIDGMRAQDR